MIDFPEIRSPTLSFRSSEGVKSPLTSQQSVVHHHKKFDVYKSADALSLKVLRELEKEPERVYSNKLDYKIVSKSWKQKLMLK